MKRILIIAFIITSSIIANAQVRADVKTPKNSNVVAYKPDEMSSSDRAYWDNYTRLYYPNNTLIITYGAYSSTNRFNCHGYAWYMSESGQELNDPRWIGYYYQTSEDIYMTDGSYVQVANEMYPGKVSWGSGDHSAITTSTPGRFKSKWRNYPLCIHDKGDSPYGTSNLKYYVATSIDGSTSNLCSGSSRAFSVKYIPGAIYTWSVGNGLTLNSNGNSSTTVTAKTSYIGATWIKVTIKSPLGNNTFDTKTSGTKTFRVGFSATVSGNSSVLYLKTGTWRASATCNSGPYNYDWFLRKDGTGMGAVLVGTGSQITLQSVREGMGPTIEKTKGGDTKQPQTSTIFYIYARASDKYGNVYTTTEKRIHAYGEVDLIPVYSPYLDDLLPYKTSDFVKVFPNPAKDNLTVKIEPNSTEDLNYRVDITLYDKFMKPAKSITSTDKEININVSTLAKGIYFMQINANGKQKTEKIMIE